jgi:hypothetical protein
VRAAHRVRERSILRNSRATWATRDGFYWLAIAYGALSARAVVLKTDQIKLNGGDWGSDFGSGLHIAGAPSGSGTVTWDYSSPSGSLIAKATVKGTLYWDAFGSGCAKVTITFENASHTAIATRTIMTGKNFCASDADKSPGGNANDSHNQAVVDESFSDPHLFFVRVKVPANSPSSKTSEAPQDGPPFSFGNSIINSGTADFGSGTHVAGSPSQDAVISLFRNDTRGTVDALVGGTLYWDSLAGAGCAQMIVDFQTATGTTLSSKTLKKCGPGGNAKRPTAEQLKGLDNIDWRLRDAESGIMIGDKSEWRRGHASEAMRLRTEYAFTELGLRKIWTGVDMPNVGSRRALEKAGYRQCGVMRRHFFVNGRWVDVWMAEIHREDWRRAREATCSAP